MASLRDRGPDFTAVADDARQLITRLRGQRRRDGALDSVMQAYPLSRPEGVALMCLAEALLRIPDQATRDRLIADALARGQWLAGLGNALFTHATAWALWMTGRILTEDDQQTLPASLRRVLARGGAPLIRAGVAWGMTRLGRQFVMGETIGQALARSRATQTHGYTHSFDMLGEAAATQADADRYYQAYREAIEAIGQAAAGQGIIDGPGISIKLSALHPRYTRQKRTRIMAELYPRLHALAQRAHHYHIGLNIDAEEADRLELSLDLVDRLAHEPTLAGWNGLGVVVQAYQKRATAVIDHLRALAGRTGRRMMVRLVKGAYWDSEIKRTQVDGLVDYPVFTRKVHTDLSYLVCAAQLLDATDTLYAQFATHNAHTVASVRRMAQDRGVDDYEFQCLHGMGEPLYDELVAKGVRCRVYAPVGGHATLLPYLVRRLLENGANSSFINQIADTRFDVASLVADPLSRLQREGIARHPGIRLPSDLLADRVNSEGCDTTDERVIDHLHGGLARLAARRWHAAPVLALPGAETPARESLSVRVNPANTRDVLGDSVDAALKDVAGAVSIAAEYAPTWNALSRTDRAGMLRDCADVLQAHRDELLSLCIREAGKTWGNAVAEIREAVDFLRYYAVQAEHAAPCPAPGPGPVVCISPWNFPLAIFVGQISAALAAGSPVLAKPAEQTPLIAHHVVGLMHQAGIPTQVLQLLPGPGETIGAALVADPRVRGVLFTGSDAVARIIQRTLAHRPVQDGLPRLIAETGGINAMIVDSSALREQVVADVIASAFDSAGQRCSALRILFLQQEIADATVVTLLEAMREISVGNPASLSTDVGPLIDRAAVDQVLVHLSRLRDQGARVHQHPLPSSLSGGHFVAPALVELDSATQLDREVFGPVLHVVRFAQDELPRVLETINTSGYGLTFGLHTRLESRAAQVAKAIKAGNTYINCAMVGAVVGMQPFGGEGKSGTGPKAGGPFYLRALTGGACGDAGWLKRQGFAVESAVPPHLLRLTQWAGETGDHRLVEVCNFYAETTPLRGTFGLPGPTGETNGLRLVGRGRVLCEARNEEGLLHQLAAVWATGNKPLIVQSAWRDGVLDRLPDDLKLQAVSVDAASDGFDVVLCDSDAAHAHAWARTVCQLSAAVVPVVCPDRYDGRYPLYRLLVERTLTVNTTASGGNASLLVAQD